MGEVLSVLPDLVPALIEMVKAYKSDQASHPLEMVAADVKCQRDNETQALCRCRDFSMDTCLDACSSGTLSESACSNPFDTSFQLEYFPICMTCASVWDPMEEYMSSIACLGLFNLLIGDGPSVI